MNSFVVIVSVLLLCAVKVKNAQTTAKVHHYHPHAVHVHATHEAKETENYSFVYDKRSQDLVIKTDDDRCYIMPLTDRQKNQIQDPANINKVEAAAIQLIVDNSIQSNIDQSLLDHHLAHFCRGSTKVIFLASN